MGLFLLVSDETSFLFFGVTKFFGIPFEKQAVRAVGCINDLQKTVGDERVLDYDGVSEEEEIGDSGSCTWTTDDLLGRCFGLQKQAGNFPTAGSCEKLCCQVGWDCITYQWRKDKGCFLGDIVRVGEESAPTDNWCEPSIPAEWTGKRMLSFSRETLTCTFRKKNLSGQCYGLGVKKPPKTPQACEELCCKTNTCTVWQFREDKGCFVGNTKNCDKDVIPWTGRRKPVPKWLLKDLKEKRKKEKFRDKIS